MSATPVVTCAANLSRVLAQGSQLASASAVWRMCKLAGRGRATWEN
jgi:hypothetical protein